MKLPRDTVLAKAKGTEQLPLVQVVWKDHSSSDYWTSLKAHRESLTPVEVISVGRLMANKPTYIQIAQTVSEERQAFNVICIAKSCIVRVSRAKVTRG